MPNIPGFTHMPRVYYTFICIDGIYTIKICNTPPTLDYILYSGTSKQIALRMFSIYDRPFNDLFYLCWTHDSDKVRNDLINELNKEFERMEKLKAFY